MVPSAIWEAWREVAGLGWFGDLERTEATSSRVACVSLLFAAALSGRGFGFGFVGELIEDGMDWYFLCVEECANEALSERRRGGEKGRS